MSENKIFILFVLLLIISCSGISVEEKGVIVIKGSDTMLHLTQKLSESFTDIYPNIHFRIFGGGTKTGIDELVAGRINICTASRNITPSEAKKLADYYGSIGVYYLIAKDAVCIYANSDIQINNLTLEQLRKIFSGSISDFSKLNLNKGKIKLAIRDADSGTRKFLNDLVLKGNEFSKSAKVFSTTKDIVDFIEENRNGIGFGGIGLAEGIKFVPINGVKANIQNAKNDKYPLTRYLHFFTSRSPSGKVKKFIDWVLSPAGQKIVKEEGFIPLWEINY